MLASLLATSSSLVARTSPSSFLAATALRRAMSTSLLSSTPPAGLIKTPEALAKKLSLKNPSLLRFDNYINGSWVSSARAESTFDVNDPASDELIAQCPDLNADEVREAITAAEGARKSWAATSVKERSDLLLKLNAIIAENTEDLAKIISIENGKPLADAKGEIAYGNGYFDWFAGEALRSYGDTIPSATPGLRNIVIKQPVGVCSILACWNFPNAMITRKLAPALAAGCTAVIKAPPETPLSALALAALVEKAGFPKGVVNILTTNKNTVDVGYEMTTNPDVRKVSFTGSSPVGALLMKQASSTLKKCSFELGGNAIFAVFADADIPKAVDGLVASKFRLSGQTCVCANRIFIHEDVYDEFAKQFIAKVSAFKLGHPLEAGVTHGPVIHARAMAKTAKHVEDAVSKGATVALGGKPLPELGPHFYAPTVLLNVPLRGTLMEQEETFGPVAGLMKFKTEDELIERANDTPFGLAGYFFTQDLGRAFRVGEAIECGMVGINTGLISQTCIPFGGVKQSGFGREGSKYGLAEYQVTKLLAISIA